VRFNGLRIALENGARSDVVECFALLHDSQRMNDGTDKSHGARAADYARRINRELLHLDAAGLDQLAYACDGSRPPLIPFPSLGVERRRIDARPRRQIQRLGRWPFHLAVRRNIVVSPKDLESRSGAMTCLLPASDNIIVSCIGNKSVTPVDARLKKRLFSVTFGEIRAVTLMLHFTAARARSGPQHRLAVTRSTGSR
jgi:hypothetical protein